MKYGVFGDIHGNLEALEKVLAEYEKEKVNRLLCVGDIVGYGADPKECLRKVRELDCPLVAGNHDHAVVNLLNVDFFNYYAREAALWTRAQLRKKDKDFLKKVELIRVVDEITLVHSNLHEPAAFDYIQTSFDAHLTFIRQTTPILFVGHSHVPVSFFLRNTVHFSLKPEFKVEDSVKTIVNVGSVGQPRDENPKAAYVVYDTELKSVFTRRVEYDVEKAGWKIIKAGLPGILAERLKYGR